MTLNEAKNLPLTKVLDSMEMAEIKINTSRNGSGYICSIELKYVPQTPDWRPLVDEGDITEPDSGGKTGKAAIAEV